MICFFGTVHKTDLTTMHSKTSSKQFYILALTIGLVYLWFGLLKFFPELSPAEDLAKNTIDKLLFGLIPGSVSIILLAIWETAIGLLLVFNKTSRIVISIALLHMALTFSPLVLFPEQSFSNLPVGFSLLGQYIFKNIIIVGSLILLYQQAPKLKTVKLG